MERPTFRYILDRLNGIKTQSDLEALKSDVEGYLPLDKFEEDFDVNAAVDNLKRDYVNRALNIKQSSDIARSRRLARVKELSGFSKLDQTTGY
jgi:hypothetical protein